MQVSVREEPGKQGLLPALFLIICGCRPEALQELWLTVPFVRQACPGTTQPQPSQVPGTEWQHCDTLPG